jgi:hypothetical protein
MATDITKLPTISSIQVLRDQCDKSIRELSTFTQQSAVDLTKEYTDLKAEIVTTLGATATTDLTALTAKLTEYTSRIGVLNGKKQTVLSEISPMSGTIPSLFILKLINILLFISVGVGLFLGGVVGAHAYPTKAWYYKVFYTIYGAALFPLTLLLGLFNPPVWRAPFIPLIIKGVDEPPWSKFLLIRPFAALLKYDPPSVETLKSTSQAVLQVLCGLTFAALAGGVLLKGFFSI